tara:strand:- start:66 stop:281 length:216 start_codon:yes stop_codon:yes gene_type:complete
MVKQTDVNWIKKALDRKGIKGKPRGKGTFTKQAQRVGLSPIQLMKKVLKEPDRYRKITIQRANLMKNLINM